MAKNEQKLWQVGCDGHRPAWVVAENWELATIEAAKFWQVPWREVACWCEEMQCKPTVATNICCICGRMYHGHPPMCDACRSREEIEERETARRARIAFARANRRVTRQEEKEAKENAG